MVNLFLVCGIVLVRLDMFRLFLVRLFVFVVVDNVVVWNLLL